MGLARIFALRALMKAAIVNVGRCGELFALSDKEEVEILPQPEIGMVTCR